jgi:hypothetical protein
VDHGSADRIPGGGVSGLLFAAKSGGLGRQDDGQGSILQNSVSAENFSDKCSSIQLLGKFLPSSKQI